MSSHRPIRLRVVREKAFVFDVNDLAILRSEHHICGTLIGTLPHMAQQNLFLGMPLLLLPEEATLLVEKGLGVFVDERKAHLEPTPEQSERARIEHVQSVKDFVAATQAKEAAEKIKGNEQSMTEEAIAKRKARELKRQAKVQAAAENPETSIMEPSTRPEVPQKVMTEEELLANSNYPIMIPTASDAFPWYDSSVATFTTLEDARAADLWNFPRGPSERALYGVYKDLWEQGYFMGVGLRFGGDYLVYPGDPLRYHSHFVASVHQSPNTVIRPMEIVAHGRLGTATKKAHLLCGWSEQDGKVTYYSVEWAAFG